MLSSSGMCLFEFVIKCLVLLTIKLFGNLALITSNTERQKKNAGRIK